MEVSSANDVTMTKNQILEQYKRISPNFMTPDIKEYSQAPDGRIIELATGTGISGEKIWGVSEFSAESGRLETTRRGQMHKSINSARRHFNSLLEMQ